MRNDRFLLIAGYIFLIWGIFDIFLKVNIYGLDELSFLWFCSVALFVLAFGIILKSPMLLNSFLAIVLLVQPFWIIDYIWMSFFNVPFNGLSSFVFQPGFGLLEFVDNFRHAFMIPFGFYAVFMISRKSLKSYLFIPAFISSLLFLSYIFVPEYNNINCVQDSCIGLLEKSVPASLYFASFIFSTIFLSLMINFGINKIFEKTEKSRHKKTYKNLTLAIFIFLMSVAIASITAASLRYSEIPKYSCAKIEDCTNCTINLECKRFYGNEENWTVVYDIKNYGENWNECQVYMKLGSLENYKNITGTIYIDPGKKYTLYHQDLKYPKADTEVKLKSNCSIYAPIALGR